MARQATHRVETWELGLWVRKKSTYGARVFALPSLRCAPTPWPPPRSARFSFLRDDQNGTRLTPATSIKKTRLSTWARAVPAPTLQHAARMGGEGGAAAVAGKKTGKGILSPPKETFHLRSRGD
jgi:hypothetical protein